ncbi:hypothetical protein RA180_21505 [Aeromonas salmonicida]|uniref:hypothetical protein n=1 Tax=Aeromonas salmonicida TaxID=645 RepID=UPI002796B87C|nr:hypothetical protein [Aeromonas salmonicida]MDQ1886569.1 hypothetical protein [Aeromonas salmonicida]
MQRNLNKIALSCLLIIGGCGAAHAWTVGTEGSSNFTGNITGVSAIGWETTSAPHNFGDIDINSLMINAAGKYEAKLKVAAVTPLFNIQMKEAGKLSQLYDNIDIAYKDASGNTLTPTDLGGGYGQLELKLSAVSTTNTSTTMEISLPLQVDSVSRLVLTDKSKYVEVPYGVNNSADSLLSGLGCESTMYCWFGDRTFLSKDTALDTYVNTKLPVAGVKVEPTPKYFEIKGSSIGPAAAASNSVGLGGLADFNVSNTDLIVASSLSLVPTRDVIITTTNQNALGDWKAVLNMEVTTN